MGRDGKRGFEDMSASRATRNVTVGGHRTSMRLETVLWDALEDICQREGRDLDEISGLVHRRRGDSSFTAAMRVFIVSYYRAVLKGDGPLEAAIESISGDLPHGPGAREGRSRE